MQDDHRALTSHDVLSCWAFSGWEQSPAFTMFFPPQKAKVFPVSQDTAWPRHPLGLLHLLAVCLPDITIRACMFRQSVVNAFHTLIQIQQHTCEARATRGSWWLRRKLVTTCPVAQSRDPNASKWLKQKGCFLSHIKEGLGVGRASGLADMTPQCHPGCEFWPSLCSVSLRVGSILRLVERQSCSSKCSTHVPRCWGKGESPHHSMTLS